MYHSSFKINTLKSLTLRKLLNKKREKKCRASSTNMRSALNQKM